MGMIKDYGYTLHRNSVQLQDMNINEYVQNKVNLRAHYLSKLEYDIANEIKNELNNNDIYTIRFLDPIKQYMIICDENHSLLTTHPANPSSQKKEKEEVTLIDGWNDEEQKVQELSKLTVVQLKEKLKKAQLPVSGLKANLIKRLIYN